MLVVIQEDGYEVDREHRARHGELGAVDRSGLGRTGGAAGLGRVMANPRKPAGRPVSMRIKPGSALERLTEGKSFTDEVHAIAERYEVLQAAMTSGRAVAAVAVAPRTIAESDAAEEEVTEVARSLMREGPRELPRSKNVQMYRIPTEDGLSFVDVDEEEALRIMRGQVPAGLEPVLDAYMIASEEADLGEAAEQDAFDYEALA